MKTHRNRREFSVGTVGWFTVLKPDSFKLGSLHAASRSKRVPTNINGQEVTMAPSMAQLGTHDVRPKRTALIVAAAMSITSALLWWIMHP